MIGNVSSAYNAYSILSNRNPYAKSVSKVNNFDYKAAQRQTTKLIEQYKQQQNSVKVLKDDSAKFLDTYRKDMNELMDSAQALEGGRFDQLLYGKGGNSGAPPSDENIEKTAKAVEDMVNEFNQSLANLDKNANRGFGVHQQVKRMILPPTSEGAMKQAGITLDKEGKMKLDTDVLKTALKKNTAVVKDVISGSYGMAHGVMRDAKNGLRQSPASLIANDLAKMQNQTMQNPINFMGTYSQSGAYNLMNMNSIGVLMNINV